MYYFMHKGVCSRLMFDMTDSFITLKSKGIIKKWSPHALCYRNSLKVAKKHNY